VEDIVKKRQDIRYYSLRPLLTLLSSSALQIDKGKQKRQDDERREAKTITK
jgi:hypothetical protein